MTNGEKFKTAEDRAEAFSEFCTKEDYEQCINEKCIFRKKYRSDECPFHWLDLDAEEDCLVVECNGHRYKSKNAKAHLSGDMLVITGCSGVRGDLSAEIRVEEIEQDNRVAKAVMESESK